MTGARAIETRSTALAEVCLATAAAHLGYKALKLVERPGWNLTPGLVLCVVATLLIRAHARRGRAFGVRPLPGKRAVSLAALLTAVVAGGAIVRGATVAETSKALVELMIGAGFAEELFFRGYVQSRLNATFARPWTILGARAGPGLVVAAVLFGLVHVFNPTLWFHGRFDVDWAAGARSCASGLFLGWLRERTGTIWAPAFVHGIADLVKRLWIDR